MPWSFRAASLNPISRLVTLNRDTIPGSAAGVPEPGRRHLLRTVSSDLHDAVFEGEVNQPGVGVQAQRFHLWHLSEPRS